MLDDGGSWREVTVTNGKRILVAKDKAGKELFNGPIDTEAERTQCGLRGRVAHACRW